MNKIKTPVYAMAVMALMFGAPLATHLISATPAFAADDELRDISNRLGRVENAISDMQRSTYGGSGDSSGGGYVGYAGDPASAAATQNRLSELEDQIRVLTGRIEEVSHQVDQNHQDLVNFKADTELRFQDLQSGGGAGMASAAGAAPTGAGSPDQPPSASGTLGSVHSDPASASANAAAAARTGPVLPNGTAQVQYDYAIDLLKRGQFDQARDGFKEFLTLHPKDPLAGNAQYWLGETYYAQGDYKNAADSFLKGYTTYSTSSKAPDSLLKLGMTLKALNQKDAACATFGELGRRFPQASPAVVARNKLERQKAGC
ncbi:MAG: tol-pal system protein YbgF [Parvibaculum sp.]